MFPRLVHRSLNVFLAITIAFLPADAFAAPRAIQASPRHCDAHRQFLDTAFQEAIDMARTAVEAIDQVKFGKDNWIAFSDQARISASVRAMFGVKTGALREPMTEANAGRLEDVQGWLACVLD